MFCVESKNEILKYNSNGLLLGSVGKTSVGKSSNNKKDTILYTFKYIIKGTRDGTLLLYNHLHQLLKSIQIHYQSITCLVSSVDELLLFSGSEDGTVLVFTLPTLVLDVEGNDTPIATLQHSLPITAIHISSTLSGHVRIYTASLDKTVVVWEWKNNIDKKNGNGKSVSKLSTIHLPDCVLSIVVNCSETELLCVVGNSLYRCFLYSGTTTMGSGNGTRGIKQIISSERVLQKQGEMVKVDYTLDEDRIVVEFGHDCGVVGGGGEKNIGIYTACGIEVGRCTGTLVSTRYGPFGFTTVFCGRTGGFDHSDRRHGGGGKVVDVGGINRIDTFLDRVFTGGGGGGAVVHNNSVLYEGGVEKGERDREGVKKQKVNELFMTLLNKC
jgi:hypothetical protein